MARRSLIVALGVISALAVLPSGAAAATAPAAAPVLTSAPYATLVSFHWIPGAGLNTSQSVYRSVGPCAIPVSAGQIQGSPIPGNATTDFVDNVADGVYCYFIQAADLVSTANSPGLTVIVDTHDPAGDHRHPERVVRGRRQRHGQIASTSADAASGVAYERAAHRRDRSVSVGAGHGLHVGHDRRRQRPLRRLQRRRRQCRPRRRRHDHGDGRRTLHRLRPPRRPPPVRPTGRRPASRRSSPPSGRARRPARRRRA